MNNEEFIKLILKTTKILVYGDFRMTHHAWDFKCNFEVKYENEYIKVWLVSKSMENISDT